MKKYFFENKIISLLLGILIISYILLANLLRGFLPRRCEDFSLVFLLSIFLFFLLLFFYSSWKLLYTPKKENRYITLFLSFPPIRSFLRLCVNSPREVYSTVEKWLPPASSLRQVLWEVIERYGPGDLRTSLHKNLYLTFFFFPYLIPPMVLGLETFIFLEIKYFYYSLLLLWLPLFFRFFVFALRDYAARQKAYLETFFALSQEGNTFLFDFYPDYPQDKGLVSDWYLLHRFQSQIYSLERYQKEYTFHLLFLRSLLYSLSWLEVLFYHPSFYGIFAS